MAYARTLIPTLGSNGPFTVPFPYLAKGHVKARIAGIPVDYSWLTSSTIVLDETPASDSELELYRETPVTPLVSFQNGPTDAYALNTGLKQSLYVSQEALDTFDLSDAGFDSSVAEAAAEAAGDAAAVAVAAAASAEGAVADALVNYVKKDGSVAFTGPFSFPAEGLRPGGEKSFFVSPVMSLRTSAGNVGSAAHGNPRGRPNSWIVALRCLTGEAGFSPGEEATPMQRNDAGQATGLHAWVSTSEVGVTQPGSTVVVPHKSTGALVAVTPANWGVVVKAVWL